MKAFKNLTIVAFCLVGFSTLAQSTASNDFSHKIEKVAVAGAQLGSLVCENANGERVLCSGSMEETVLGIVTNVPYITLNKPAGPNDSKFIFNATVSAKDNAIAKGDFLAAGQGGNLVYSSDKANAYAIALDDVSGGTGMIRVKLIK